MKALIYAHQYASYLDGIEEFLKSNFQSEIDFTKKLNKAQQIYIHSKDKTYKVKDFVTALESKKYEMIIFPGANETSYGDDLFTDKKVIKSALDKFCNDGGNIIGFCGGAYIMMEEVIFQNISAQSLGVVPGVAFGDMPELVGGKRFKEPGAGQMLNINSDLGSDKQFYHGGCCFKQISEKTEILQRYENEEVATIFHKIGKGGALLTGTHPEATNDRNSHFIKLLRERIR